MPEISEANATGPVTWVLDDEALAWLGESILGAERIVVDLETTGLDEHAVEGGRANGGVGARISLASFTLPQAKTDAFGLRVWDGEVPTTWVLPLSHPDSPWVGKWKRVVWELLHPAIVARIPFENQNMKFDSRWLYATTGVDPSSLIVWDTKDGQFLLDENESTRLKEFVPRVFNVPAWNDFDLSTPGASEKVPLLDLGLYAARDTWWTWKAGQYQRDRMFLGDVEEQPYDQEEREDAMLGKLATWVAMPTVGSLTKAEQRGIRLDVDWVRTTLQADMETATEAFDEMAEYAKMDRAAASTAPTSHWFLEFMDRGVANDDIMITDLTPNGRPSWSGKTLKRQLRKGSPVAEMVLKARTATKRAEFLRAWLARVTPAGYIHANFNSGSVKTGRLSSSDPNLQQVTKKLRPAFIPRPGHVIADFDYSQIELRVAAFVSRCEPMIQAFLDGQDLHRLMGATIVSERRKSANRQHAHEAGWAILEEMVGPFDITAEERQQAKAANFGLLYEMGPLGFKEYAETAYGVLLTEEEAVQIHAAFFKMWDGMKDWHERVKREVMAKGYVKSPLGRIRRLPNIWDGNPKLVSSAERQAINSPVQSMASDLLQMSMASVQGLLPSQAGLPEIAGALPVATVHDSIVVELPEDRWEETAQAVAERMQSLDGVLAKFGVDFDVPLLADYSVGTRWSWSDVSDPQEVPAEALNVPSLNLAAGENEI